MFENSISSTKACIIAIFSSSPSPRYSPITALSKPCCSSKNLAMVKGSLSLMKPCLTKNSIPLLGLKLNCLIPSCKAVLRCFKFSNSCGSSTSSIEKDGDNGTTEPLVLDLFLFKTTDDERVSGVIAF